MGGYEKFIPLAVERYHSNQLSGDYTAMASGLGVYAERVSEPSEIVPAIRRAIEVTAAGRPALLEMITRQEAAVSRP
jgi:thiamine pyrophosphate-dependent acetolactate synthase large subunit-like protein